MNIDLLLHISVLGIDNLNDIGCFGLTELGYGNNAVEMETTAIFDKVVFRLCRKFVNYYKSRVFSRNFKNLSVQDNRIEFKVYFNDFSQNIPIASFNWHSTISI